jgi:hypothetical protein
MTLEQATQLNLSAVKDSGNDLAFPIDVVNPDHRGLTKREYIATRLLSAMITQGIGSDVAAELAVDATDKLLIELKRNR